MTMVGIDLGTTNSLVAHWSDGSPRLIKNALGHVLTPSVVSLLEDGTIVVGQAACDRLQTHPDQSAAVFKRAMGTQKQFALGKRSFRAEELSALVLRSLKSDAEAALGEKIDSAVITVPAYFNDTQRQATRIAAELAGLTVRRLINEPTAASIAYGLHDKPDFSTVVVLDIGGGTFDVSVLEMFDGVMQIHSSAGDNQLGGEDFNLLLAEFLLGSGDKEVALPDLSQTEKASLFAEVERAKQNLSTQPATQIRWSGAGVELTIKLTRSSFEEISKPLLQRMAAPIERALRDADIPTTSLDGVVLVGGASRMPAVRALSARLLGRLPFVQVNPDEVVALGAAVQVGLIDGEAELDEIVLTDVAPYSLGVGIQNPGGKSEEDLLFTPLIERNTPIPASREGSFITVHDYQGEVQLRVFQGESRRTLENVELGGVTVKVPRESAGKEQVIVRFTYDISGLLEVEATVVSTQKCTTMLLQREESLLSDKEIADRLKELTALKQHPRDQAENVAATARGERLYQEYIGERREAITEQLTAFDQVIQSQDPQLIAAARSELMDFLDFLET